MTADASGLRSGTSEGAEGVRDLGASFDATSTKARAAGDALAAQARVLQQYGVAVDQVRSKVASFNGLSIDKALGIGQGSGRDRAADIKAYGQALDAVRAKFVPLFAAGQQYKTTLREIAEAERVGAVSAREAAAARDKLKASFATQVTNMRAAQRGGLQSWQRTNLMYQANDVFTSLVSGQNPLMVLAQQGPQITQIYGGVGATIRGLAGAISATTLATAAGLGVVVAGGLAWKAYADQQERVTRALNGVGRASGLTLGQFSQASGAVAARAGLSTSNVRDLMAGYVGTGRIGAGLAGDLSELTKKYASTTGQELQEAGADLARAFADPAKGADFLNEKFGLLDDSTRENIRSLQMIGATAAAQGVLFRSLASDLETVETRSNAVSRTWQEMKNRMSDRMSEVGKLADDLFYGKPVEEQLAKARENRASMGPRPTDAFVNGYAAQQNYDAIVGRMDAEIRDLEAKVAAAQTKAGFASINQQAKQASIQLGEAVRGVLPELGEVKKINDEIARMQELLRQGGFNGTDLGFDQIQEAYTRLTHARDTMISTDERQRQSDALSLRSITVRTAAQRAAIAAERELLAARGKAESPEAGAQRAHAAAAEVFAREQEEARKRLLSANDNASLTGLPDYQRRQRELDIRYRDILEGSSGDAKATADNQAAAAIERQALARAAMIGPMREANRALEEQRAALQLQAASFGKSTEAVAAMAAKQQLLNQYQRAGVPITADLRAEIDRYAADAGRVAKAQEDLQAAQARVVNGMDAIRGEARSAFGGVLSNLREGKSIADSLLGSATRIIDQVIEARVTGPLIADLLGKDGTAGGGMFGDTVAGWLGGKSALQTANIQAANVNINGISLTGAGLPGAPGTTGSIGSPSAASSGQMAPAGKLPALTPITSSALPDPVAAASFAAAKASGTGTFKGVGNYLAQGAGNVDGRLRDILEQAAARSGYRVEAFSGLRPGDSRFHRSGLATDIQLYDPGTGARLGGNRNGGWGHYQSPQGFRDYEKFAQTARQYQMERYPELNRQFRWGGYFSSPSGPRGYGALDGMHFDLGGGRVGMAGGSWANGLNPFMRRAYPGIQSQGMGANDNRLPPQFNQLSASIERLDDRANGLQNSFADVSKNMVTGAGSLDKAATGMGQQAASFQAAGTGIFDTVLGGIGQVGNGFVSGLGSALQMILSAISQDGGGGFGGLFSGIGKLLGFADGGLISGPGTGRSDSILARVSNGEFMVNAAATARHLPLLHAINSNSLPAFADGGLAGPASAGNATSALPLSALAGAIGRLNDRLSAANAPASSGSSGTTVVIENRAGAQITTREESAPGGGRRQRVMIDTAVADAAGRPNSRTMAAMAAQQRVARR